MKPDTVTASEIGEYVFCPESWRLARTGQESANRFIQKAGTAHHRWKAIAERVAAFMIAIGRILILAALLALSAWVLIR